MMDEAIETVLNRLDEMNGGGEINYEVYREMYDLVSMIPDEAAPEPEWEYQCTNSINTTGLLTDPELHARQCSGRIERRRKAGPWLRVHILALTTSAPMGCAQASATTG